MFNLLDLMRLKQGAPSTQPTAQPLPDMMPDGSSVPAQSPVDQRYAEMQKQQKNEQTVGALASGIEGAGDALSQMGQSNPDMTMGRPGMTTGGPGEMFANTRTSPTAGQVGPRRMRYNTATQSFEPA